MTERDKKNQQPTVAAESAETQSTLATAGGMTQGLAEEVRAQLALDTAKTA
jgi:hypothetical protein